MSEPTDAVNPRRHVGGRDLPAAILVGALLATLVVAAVLWRDEAVVAVVLALVVIAYLDAGRALADHADRPMPGPLLASAPVLIVAPAVLGPHGQGLGVAFLLGATVTAVLLRGERDGVVQRTAVTLLFGVWVGFLASYAVLLLGHDDGAVLLLTVVGVVALVDIGGYAFGVPFGRHKLAPRLSPKKSWEGLVGGLVLAAAVGAGVIPLVTSLGPVQAAAFAVLCGAAGFVGDLVESMVKRDLGVKDLGTALPGHGGVLDRVDGVLFALPLAHYVLVVVG